MSQWTAAPIPLSPRARRSANRLSWAGTGAVAWLDGPRGHVWSVGAPVPAAGLVLGWTPDEPPAHPGEEPGGRARRTRLGYRDEDLCVAARIAAR
ncbi:hypothetical protein [Streptomyces iranensis]|uniref:Uncharacterized protein n=1 Tax=Streptomyces iranensis TaxID=576784 RepID=A0A061A9T3_9ACTN|nr:hypothetical protein [Streptomyces iranensis]MBP2060597.1 hypothetical protein [Streptomyces iranensis]CDR16843.1 predicted protein [Streptomyces iranensis]